MPAKLLRLDQGLNTAKAPVMIGEGEMTVAQDAYYKIGDPAPSSVKGRTAFNAANEAGPIKGLRYLEFEGGTDLLVAHVASTYRSATAAATGTFANLVTGLTGGTTLDSVHYNNVHYLLNGVDRNRAIASDGTASLHGMLANTTAPSVSRDAGTGTGFILTLGQTITYWVEERVKSGSTILKRNASTSTTTVTLTGDGTTDKPVITRPATINSDATHWALFATATNGSWPVGAEIAEVVIGTTFIEDTRIGTDPALPAGSLYESVTVELNGVVQNFAKNGPPPVASTGDILEDSIVLNDANDVSKIWYTQQDAPNVFPPTNFIRFETKEADEVKCLRTVGKSLIVLLRESLWRIDTLPRPEDSAFETERIKEQIQGANGCVGPLAADVFSDQNGARLAYVSRSGIFVTDGYTWDSLTDDIDWPSTVEEAQLGNAVLRYLSRQHILAFYYTAPGFTRNTKALYLHVHPSHRKENGKPKITGPIQVAANCAAVANISGIDEVFTGNTDGVVYREWTGFTDASAIGGPTFAITTGDQYVAGIGNQIEVRRFWVHHAASDGVSGTFTFFQLNSGGEGANVSTTINLTDSEATPVYKDCRPEGIRLSLLANQPSAQVSINAFVLDIPEAKSTRQ